jgi:hypothetical protein
MSRLQHSAGSSQIIPVLIELTPEPPMTTQEELGATQLDQIQEAEEDRKPVAGSRQRDRQNQFK